MYKHNDKHLEKAFENEPIFVLLARDPVASKVIMEWVKLSLRTQPASKLNQAVNWAKKFTEEQQVYALKAKRKNLQDEFINKGKVINDPCNLTMRNYQEKFVKPPEAILSGNDIYISNVQGRRVFIDSILARTSESCLKDAATIKELQNKLCAALDKLHVAQEEVKAHTVNYLKLQGDMKVCADINAELQKERAQLINDVAEQVKACNAFAEVARRKDKEIKNLKKQLNASKTKKGVQAKRKG